MIVRKDIEPLVKDINEHDLEVMFGTKYYHTVLNRCSEYEEIYDELMAYELYDVPVGIGDIAVIDGDVYVVTLVYTDKTVDLCDEKGNRCNTGIYGLDVVVIGQLDCVEEN